MNQIFPELLLFFFFFFCKLGHFKLVSKISRKLIELGLENCLTYGGLKLGQLIVDDEQIT